MKTLGEIFKENNPKLQTEPMNDDLSKMFISFVMMEQGNSTNQIEEIYKGLSKQIWSLEALNKRGSKLLTTEFSKSVLCFLSILTEGNIGQGLLYMYYIQWKSKQLGFNKITIKELSHIFPMGFFTEDSLHELWDSQKSEKGGNIIDDSELCKDIQL